MSQIEITDELVDKTVQLGNELELLTKEFDQKVKEAGAKAGLSLQTEIKIEIETQ